MPKKTSAFTSALAQFGALAIFCAAAANLLADAAADDANLDVLSGTWRGDGTMSFESGQTEGISCNGYYKGGGHLNVVIRCKGSSANFELRSKLRECVAPASAAFSRGLTNPGKGIAGSPVNTP